MGWVLATFMLARLVAVARPGPAFIALTHTARGFRAFVSGCTINLNLRALFRIKITFYGAHTVWLSQPAYLNLKRRIGRSAAAVMSALGLNFLLSRP